MRAKIIDIRAKKITGMMVKLEEVSEVNLMSAWENYIEILQETDEIENLRECYGYCKNYGVEEGKISLDYFMGMDSESYNLVPRGFSEEVVPGGKYAVYIYRGKIDQKKIKEFNEDIYYRWLEEDGLTPLRNEGVEYYGAKYKHGEEDSEFEMWIPVK